MTARHLDYASPPDAMLLRDDQRHAPGGEALARLCQACEDEPQRCWSAIGDTILRTCFADDAGVVLEPAGHAAGGPALPPATLAALRSALVAEPRIIHWYDDAGALHYVAAAIGGDPSAGFVWARRAHAFEWWQALPLRWLSHFASLTRSLRNRLDQAELLLLESYHRSSNDLQLVSGLLSFEWRKSDDDAVRHTLEKMSERVLALARARRSSTLTLPELIERFAAAVRAQVEDRGIAVEIHSGVRADIALSEQRRGLLMIAINECVTNTLKHGFPEGRAGTVRIDLRGDGGMLVVRIEDDGVAIPGGCRPRDGSGLDLVARVLTGARGRLRLPPDGTKIFTVELPMT